MTYLVKKLLGLNSITHLSTKPNLLYININRELGIDHRAPNSSLSFVNPTLNFPLIQKPTHDGRSQEVTAAQRNQLTIEEEQN